MGNAMHKLGPIGMKGKIWDEKYRSELVEIQISHEQDCIKSIHFTYRTGMKVSHSQTHGEPTGSKFNMVELDYTGGEVLTSVSGEYKDGRLVAILFGTNKSKYGPFGKTGCRTSCEDFRYEFKAGRFGGFHGSVLNGYVDAIGVYVKPYVATSRLCNSWYTKQKTD